MNFFKRFKKRIRGSALVDKKMTVESTREINGQSSDEQGLRKREAELQVSEERFSSAFEHAAIGMALVSPDGHWLKVNQALCELLGYTAEELRTKTFQDITHPDDLQADLENVRLLLAGKVRNYRMEKRYFHKRGQVVHALLSVSLVRQAQGEPGHFISQIQDISEMKKSADTLRRNQEALNNAQRIAHFGSWEVDLDPAHPETVDANPLRWSDEIFRIFGYEPNEIKVSTENFFNMVHPDDRQMVKDAAVAATTLGKPYSIDHRIVRPNGTIRHVHEEAQIMKDPVTNRALRMVGFVQDITERKAAEQKLIEQAALIDQARDAIILRDLNQTILFWNKGAERLYGWTAQEAVGRKTTDLIYKSAGKITQAMKSMLGKGEWSGDLESVTKSGQLLNLECRWTLLRDADGQPKSVLCINTDITERKKIEGQFLRAQRMESIGTLAGGIAHDLNNLLSPIIMGIDLLKMQGLTPVNARVVEDIERSAKRGSHLVRQVLSFARGVEGARMSVHIGAVLGEVASIINNTFPKNITLDVRNMDKTWLVAGDPTHLNQVFLNLAVNARDAMPDGGVLTIATENVFINEQDASNMTGITAGRYVLVEVSDTGCGIPVENLEKIFDPFFTTKELSKGTGLGLATTLGIVRSHGGSITVYSEPGRGSSFKTYLPVQADDAQAESEDTYSENWPRGNGECILVVDDETSILTITQQTLETFGYRVLTAEHGAQAVSQFALNQDKISLVITDMMMPVMDGPATIVALREIDPRVRIVATSGLNSGGHAGKAVNAGVKLFLSKPYTTRSLLDMIKVALSEKL